MTTTDVSKKHKTEGVCRLEFTPGNGYRYIAYTSALPAEEDGGAPNSHVLVTLLQPYVAAAVVPFGEFLHQSYIVEKFVPKGEEVHVEYVATLVDIATRAKP